jgi:phosphoribosylformylglycinamidine cyclo-ligase
VTSVTDSYEDAGVRDQAEALSAVTRHLGPTLSLPDARLLTGLGHYAAVMQLTEELAIAICTDGVGSKTIVASTLGRYDTIGFDCMAMNVNDLLCVGARPFALVDYLGVNTLDDARTEQILAGLGAAAKEAGVAIPGGEIAQLPEVVGSDGKDPGDETAFDLVGTAVGSVHPDRLVLGHDVAPGDALIGLASSGIHSNGLTLARHALRKAGLRFDEHRDELGRTLGEELLEPTEIYVRAITALWDEGLTTKGLAHITGDGLLNLCRLEADVGYEITSPQEPQAIFSLIQDAGGVSDAEMHRVFNMGTGFVVVVDKDDVESCVEKLTRMGARARRIGSVSNETGRVRLAAPELVGDLEGGFAPG